MNKEKIIGRLLLQEYINFEEAKILHGDISIMDNKIDISPNNQVPASTNTCIIDWKIDNTSTIEKLQKEVTKLQKDVDELNTKIFLLESKKSWVSPYTPTITPPWENPTWINPYSPTITTPWISYNNYLKDSNIN